MHLNLKFNFFFFYKELQFKIFYNGLMLFFTAICCYFYIHPLLFLCSKILLLQMYSNKFFYSNLIEIFNDYLYLAILFALIFTIPFMILNIFGYFVPSCYKKDIKLFFLYFLICFFFYFYIIYFFFIFINPNFFSFFLFFEKENVYFPLYFEAHFSESFKIIFKFFFIYFFFCQMPIYIYFFLKIFFKNLNILLLFKKYFIYYLIIFILFLDFTDFYIFIYMFLSIYLFLEFIFFIQILQKKILGLIT